MILNKTPFWLKKITPSFTWSFSGSNSIYLTFDDGPTPEVTPWILAELKKYNAKATFFCLGKNVKEHPGVYRQILAHEHSVGNHTFHHLNGWKTKTKNFISDVQQANDFIDSRLFRPPYGRIKRSQMLGLRDHYKIIMWDVLCGDYNKKYSKEKCLRAIFQNTCAGSIIVLHDSLKAKTNMQYVLPLILEHYTGKGFLFSAIPFFRQ